MDCAASSLDHATGWAWHKADLHSRAVTKTREFLDTQLYYAHLTNLDLMKCSLGAATDYFLGTTAIDHRIDSLTFRRYRCYLFSHRLIIPP